MPSLLRAFQLGCESYISSASFRKPTALLASPSFGRWNHGHMTVRHRTSHTAGMPQDGDGPFAPAEREKIRRLLQQGYGLFDVFRLEDHISRRPRMVFDAMVEEDKELASLVRKRKRGKWSDEEKEHLIKLTNNRRRIDIESIARQIGRGPGAVRYQLRLMAKEKSAELGNDAVSFSAALLDKGLGKEKQSILEARMCQIIDRLLEEGDATTQWRTILSAKSAEAWVATILALIPTPVKHILAAPRPPTAADWRSLAWQDTSLFGVYAWVLKRGRGSGLNPLRVEDYVYIGSATNRITGHFATLLVMEPASSEIGDITKAQELVVFTEAIFTIWFGALTETKSAGVTDRADQHRRLHSLSPWVHTQRFNYRGLCSHNPLGLDLEPRGGIRSSCPMENTDPRQSGPVVDYRATES
ncbi:hypothetical protein QC762_305120 [Podospora pseudocomata]|uniref:Myb-like domain-containing protein n=1 Tax=Podospora pseudocomata TaxID=2093779 RepID=A0ABR0GJ22_9PEZI|nr:hypothetical protein QC762_305120 [Podospora pseudocomata]